MLTSKLLDGALLATISFVLFCEGTGSCITDVHLILSAIGITNFLLNSYIWYVHISAGCYA